MPKKRIHRFDIKEISLVDGPAILKPIEVVKALGETTVKTENEPEVPAKGEDGAAIETTDATAMPAHDALMKERLALLKKHCDEMVVDMGSMDQKTMYDKMFKMSDAIWAMRDLVPIITTKALELREQIATKADPAATLDTLVGCVAQLAQHLREKSQKEITVTEPTTTEKTTEKSSLAERLLTEEGRKALQTEAEAAGFEMQVAPKADPRFKALEDRLKAQDDKIAAQETKLEEQSKALAAAGNSGAATQQPTSDETVEDKTKAKDPEAKYRGSAFDRSAVFGR